MCETVHGCWLAAVVEERAAMNGTRGLVPSQRRSVPQVNADVAGCAVRSAACALELALETSFVGFTNAPLPWPTVLLGARTQLSRGLRLGGMLARLTTGHQHHLLPTIFLLPAPRPSCRN